MEPKATTAHHPLMFSPSGHVLFRLGKIQDNDFLDGMELVPYCAVIVGDTFNKIEIYFSRQMTFEILHRKH